ncbi:MAG: thiolase family protein [Acidimicrobiia bacterium]|nr:MAG: thiolase family protein [Acidimicrobiia bacterium]
MRNAVIVDAVRTPVGRRNGGLRDIHPVDLASIPLSALIERTGIDPALVDDVILGCVSQTGEQAFNVARNAVLAAGFPEEVPGTTVDRQCGSGQQAVHFAAQGIMAGAYDVAIAGGVESMSRIPMGVTAEQGPGFPFGPKMLARYAQGLVPQGLSAEMMADKWGLSREYLDSIALDSHTRAALAADEGRFDSQIVPVETPGGLITRDEGIRRETSAEALASLKPAFKADGRITAGNSSQISDGAAALLVMGEDVAERLGLTPLVRFRSFAVAGADPVIMLSAPIPATFKAVERAGIALEDVDLFEVNEAFASVPGAWLAETGVPWEKVNVNGGAIALGHPLGCSGARVMTTLIHEMRRTGARYGLQAICEGGGMANATLLEAV